MDLLYNTTLLYNKVEFLFCSKLHKLSKHNIEEMNKNNQIANPQKIFSPSLMWVYTCICKITIHGLNWLLKILCLVFNHSTFFTSIPTLDTLNFNFSTLTSTFYLFRQLRNKYFSLVFYKRNQVSI